MSQKNCMTEKEQIEEMAKLMCDDCARSGSQCELNKNGGMCDAVIQQAECIYNAGYRKQIEGEWEWFEEWSPSTSEHPRECDDCGWRCGRCKVVLEDMVGGYWDNIFEKPKLNYCPNCGARMKVGA